MADKTTSPLGVRHIVIEEAIVTVAYLDGVRKDPTDPLKITPLYSYGVGHGGVAADAKILPLDAIELLIHEDLPKFEVIVNRSLGDRDVPQAWFDMLVSCALNKTTATRRVCELFDGEEDDLAWHEFAGINMDSHGKFRLGLLRRREREITIAQTGHYEPDGRLAKLYMGDPTKVAPIFFEYPTDGTMPVFKEDVNP